jgi:photosystem II stability/assembly factor-like uncharacterized protein
VIGTAKGTRHVYKGVPNVNRFERVIQILDEAIGGPEVQISIHGAFWRLPRDQFVAFKVFDSVDAVVVGNGASSNLVKALKGEAPFDGSQFPRMPVGGQVPGEAISFIERWIDDGCPEDPLTSGELIWRPLGDAPVVQRYDDVWFLTPERGWAVNSDAKVLRTSDGGATWQATKIPDAVYLRCVAFASELKGWVGTVTPGRQLYETGDGGVTWQRVELPAEAPALVCGLSVVNDSVVYASGTNHNTDRVPNRKPRVMRTKDGGRTWSVLDMGEHASLLIDIYFVTPEIGWVVGGKTHPDPGPMPPDRPGCNLAWKERWDVKPVVLFTEDGGQTWVNRVADLADDLPLGEWGWKIQFVTKDLGFVSLENFFGAAILKTTDGGQSWKRIEVRDPQGNANLEGIGFISEEVGWVGGWGSCDMRKQFSSATTDGGTMWVNANEIGMNINRFRFFGNPVTVGYACGRTLYKYSSEPPLTGRQAGHFALAELQAPRLLQGSELLEGTLPIRVGVTVPDAANHLAVNVWDPQFGDHVRQLLNEPTPRSGDRVIEWDGKDDSGQSIGPGSFVVRVTVDDDSDSRVVWVGGP